jgi:hypothetical protein
VVSETRASDAAAARMKMKGQIGNRCRMPMFRWLNMLNAPKIAAGTLPRTMGKATERMRVRHNRRRSKRPASASRASVAAGVFTAKATGK